ncbi:hypothetical protein L1987_07027 [Smallanthus sonchifolius]|uniref:Uncharacterized protein n=1 Tax=Smallanthus sonchifolius TaxID=185202 RepID=A0ACB9JZV8_9ASTR|nr:hypothetical protein L1987_07027 [Smallanthus sonchifolius]
MIPTPGLPQSGNSNLMAPSSANCGNSIMSSAVNQGSFSMNTLGPSRSAHTDGGLTDGSLRSLSYFSESSGGISSTGGQRLGSQMMPTPGFNNNTSNQSYVKLEQSNNVPISQGDGSGNFFVPATSETSEQQQQQQQRQPHFGVDTRNNVTGQPEAALQGQWHSSSHQLGNLSNEIKIREVLPGITGQNQIQRNNLSSEASMAAKRSVDPPSDRQLQFKNQQRWLLFLRHARKCGYPPGSCPESHCIIVQKLWKHIMSCNGVTQCQYPRCHKSKMLLHHHKHCKDQSCPVCVPVKDFIQRIGVQHVDFPQSGNGSCDHTSEDFQPSMKRMKIVHSAAAQNENQDPIIPVSITATSEDLQDRDTCRPLKYEASGVKLEVPASSMQGFAKISEANNDGVLNEDIGSPKQEFSKTEKQAGQAKQEDMTLVAETSAGTKSGKPKIKGVSMIELFTPEQVQEHITGLRQWVGQSKAKVEKNQAMELSMNENSCQLCAVEKLNFEPPPLYCSACGARIKRNAMFYTWGSGDTRHFFCIPCYNESRGDTISFDGTNILKAKLEKKKNDEETEEPWVQCDKCEAWQHQVCALFNGRRNDGGQAEYTCPNCYVEEVERGERVPLPQSALLGAKDLPRTILSDHIENRLFKRLRQERLDRARFHGKSYDEVPGAESLVVRVVSSVDKKLEVKQRFLEIFQEENYPSEFAYKSKVVLLFQKIEGVEVCLFGMYVQEFGAECKQPNHRRVYLSYLDSVKYFRPEIRTVTGEALRTFVYHEILASY